MNAYVDDEEASSIVEPRLIRRENGGWLAVSPDGAPFRIGVEAWSADEARNRFSRAMREWVALLADEETIP